jgi:uncharacterized membrane protein
VIPLLALAALAWLALLLSTPLLPLPGAGLMYLAGALICHQLPERSFHLGVAQLPVCARCLGIYAGAAVCLGVHACARGTAWRSLGALRRIVVAAALPTAITVAVEWTGLWHPSNVLRAAAGVVLGVGLACVVVEAAAKLHYEPCVPQRRIAPRPPATPI